jgi:flagellar biosynthesis/type III secretory pathway protein FliH
MSTTAPIQTKPQPQPRPQHQTRPAPPAPRLGLFFSEDFDAPKVVAPPPPEPEPVEPPELVPYFTEQELAAARREGYEAGVADLRAATLEAHEAAVAQSLSAIVTSLADTQTAAERIAEAAAEGVARVLLRILSTILPALCIRHGADEIEAVMRRVLPRLKSEPSIVVQVNPDNAEALRARLEGFAPDLIERVTFQATEAIEPGDVRLSWQDGEAVRDCAALWREIADVLQPLGLLLAETEASSTQTQLEFS